MYKYIHQTFKAKGFLIYNLKSTYYKNKYSSIIKIIIRTNMHLQLL